MSSSGGTKSVTYQLLQGQLEDIAEEEHRDSSILNNPLNIENNTVSVKDNLPNDNLNYLTPSQHGSNPQRPPIHTVGDENSQNRSPSVNGSY
jgi:hypothetical protein